MQPFQIPRNPNQPGSKKPNNPTNRYPAPTIQTGTSNANQPNNPINKAQISMPFTVQTRTPEGLFDESPTQPRSGSIQINDEVYNNRQDDHHERDESVNIGEMTEKGNDDEEPHETREERPGDDLTQEMNIKHSSEYRKGRYDEQHPEEFDMRDDPTDRSNKHANESNINILERRSMPLGNLGHLNNNQDQAALSVKIQKLELELQKEKNRNSILENEINRSKNESSNLKSEVADLRIQVQNAHRQQVTGEKDEEIARLGLELKKITNNYNATKDHLERILEQHRNYQEHSEGLITSLQEDNYRLNREIEQLRAETNEQYTNTINSYREREKIFDQRLQTYEETIKTLHDEIQIKTETLTKVMSLKQEIQMATTSHLQNQSLRKSSDLAKSLQPKHEDSPKEPPHQSFKPTFHPPQDTQKVPLKPVHKPQGPVPKQPFQEFRAEPTKIPSIEKRSDAFYQEPPKQDLPTSINFGAGGTLILGEGNTMILDTHGTHTNEEVDSKTISNNSKDEMAPLKIERTEASLKTLNKLDESKNENSFDHPPPTNKQVPSFQPPMKQPIHRGPPPHQISRPQINKPGNEQPQGEATTMVLDAHGSTTNVENESKNVSNNSKDETAQLQIERNEASVNTLNTLNTLTKIDEPKDEPTTEQLPPQNKPLQPTVKLPIHQPPFNQPPIRGGPGSFGGPGPNKMPPPHQNRPGGFEPPRKPMDFVPGNKTQVSPKKEESVQEEKKEESTSELKKSQELNMEPPRKKTSEDQPQVQEHPPIMTTQQQEPKLNMPPPHKGPFGIQQKPISKKNPFGGPDLTKSTEITTNEAENFFDSLPVQHSQTLPSTQGKGPQKEELKQSSNPENTSNEQQDLTKPPPFKKPVVKKAIIPGNMFA